MAKREGNRLSGELEAQLLEFVSNLTGEYSSLAKLAEKMLLEAEKQAANIKTEAEREAEAQATEIIAEARQKAQEIAEEEAKNILLLAAEKAETVESRAKQVYQGLLSGLENTISELQSLEVEWGSKTIGKLEDEAAVETGKLEADIELEARREVEAHATRVIAEAKQKAREIVDEMENEAKAVAEEAAKNMLMSAAQRAAVIEAQAKQQAEQVLADRRIREKGEIEEKQASPSTLASEMPEPLGQSQVAILTKDNHNEQDIAGQCQQTEVVTEEPLSTHKDGESSEDEFVLPAGDGSTSYEGELDLASVAPTDAGQVLKLYRYLQVIPQLKILRTVGSWSKGTTITVLLEKPIPLANMLRELPWIEGVAENGAKRQRRRIAVTLKRYAQS